MNDLADTLPADLRNEFVNVAHGDLNRVKDMLDQYPDLISVINSDGDETALGAAAHMGNRQIVQFLLDHGATLDIATAAMMGWRDEVADFLSQDAAQAKSTGAHGYALLFFVAQSGDTEMADMILKHGGGDGLKYPLRPLNSPSIFGAIQFDHLEMVQWFLDHGADVTVRDYDDRTPLEVAVEHNQDEIASLLRDHIGPENLEKCNSCGQLGYRVVARRDGSRWGAHTTYYTCRACDTEMGAQARDD